MAGVSFQNFILYKVHPTFSGLATPLFKDKLGRDVLTLSFNPSWVGNRTVKGILVALDYIASAILVIQKETASTIHFFTKSNVIFMLNTVRITRIVTIIIFILKKDIPSLTIPRQY